MAAVFCSLVALLVATLLLARYTAMVRDTTQKQARLADWQRQLQAILVSLTDAETGQRGYLLTGEKLYLAPYAAAMAQLPGVLQDLDAMARQEPRFARLVRDIHAQAAAKLAELAGTVHLQDTGDTAGALALVQTGAGERYMERLRADIQALGTLLDAAHRQIAGVLLARNTLTQRLEVLTACALALFVLLAALQIANLLAARSRYAGALAASERFMRAITDAVPLRLCYFDATGRLQFANRRLRERIGRPPEEIIGHTLDEAMGAPAGAISKRLKSALGGRLERFERSDVVKGSLRRLETHLIPDIGPAGEVRGVFGVGVDITRLKNIETSLRRLTEVFDNTPDYVAQADWKGRVRYLNPAARRAVGLGASEPLEGRMFSEFYTPETNARWADEIIPAVRNKGAWIGETSVLLTGAGAVPISHMVIAHRDSQGRIARYTSIMRDIRHEVAARVALARQTATLNAVIESIPATIAIWDADRRCRLVNREFERWRGVGREALVGHTLEEVFNTPGYQPDGTGVLRALSGETVTYEHDYPAPAGRRYLAVTYTPLRLKDGTVVGFVAVTQDISLHRRENKRLARLAARDPLTGLLNRIGFESHLEQVSAQGEDGSLALIYIDLDHFKAVNDGFGHATGDEVLRELANRMKHAAGPGDAVARLGGDEFAIAVAASGDGERATALAAR
ncbi:MAG TPA: PAS domain-containing protein, partial [Steroidobacteraceae bacterium]|nr:PAS domain-containing protein [Steroidobacteraceae bacterium]